MKLNNLDVEYMGLIIIFGGGYIYIYNEYEFTVFM